MSDIINLKDKQLEKILQGKDRDYQIIAKSYLAAIDAIKEIGLLTAKQNQAVNNILIKLNKKLDDYAKM